MKIAIIYKSVHKGNTKKIAEAMASVMDAELFDIKNFDIKTWDNYELIGLGSGIYFNKHHNDIIKFVKKLSDNNGKKVFVFSTSGVGSEVLNFNLKQLLEKKGCNVIGSWACKGFDAYGPYILLGGINKNSPEESDIQKAKDFAKSLIN
ncbi:MAG TPA: flavodoxin family protein [Candidatus Pacearchaeota archaeon]|nr:flavodoxin family protein [Candidatus Pacearchaeota archaeon]